MDRVEDNLSRGLHTLCLLGEVRVAGDLLQLINKLVFFPPLRY